MVEEEGLPSFVALVREWATNVSEDMNKLKVILLFDAAMLALVILAIHSHRGMLRFYYSIVLHSAAKNEAA